MWWQLRAEQAGVLLQPTEELSEALSEPASMSMSASTEPDTSDAVPEKDGNCFTTARGLPASLSLGARLPPPLATGGDTGAAGAPSVPAAGLSRVKYATQPPHFIS